MANLNKVLLIGRLTKDPQMRTFDSGNSVCSLSLATNRKFKGRDGDDREETLFVEIKLWGRQAEICEQYLSKGREVFVEGRLVLEKWEDKTTGQERQRIIVNGDRVQFLGGKDDGAGGGDRQKAGASSRGYGQTYGGNNYGNQERSRPKPSFSDDDIPF